MAEEVQAKASYTEAIGTTSGVPPPQLALPKGGGAIHGFGEKFGANPATGKGSFTVPIYTGPRRSGFGQQERRYSLWSRGEERTIADCREELEITS